jgi:hypothetical protein
MSNSPDNIFLDLSTINSDTTGSAIKTNLEFSETRTQNIIDNPSNYFLSVVRFEVDTPNVSLPIFIPLINNDGVNTDRDETIYTMCMAKTGTGADSGLLMEGTSLNVKWSPEDKSAQLPSNPTAVVSKQVVQPFTLGTLNNSDVGTVSTFNYAFTTPLNMSNSGGALQTPTKPTSLAANDLAGTPVNAQPSNITLGLFPGRIVFDYTAASLKILGVNVDPAVFKYDLTGWAMNIQNLEGFAAEFYVQNSVIETVVLVVNPIYGDPNIVDLVYTFPAGAFQGHEGTFEYSASVVYDPLVIPMIRYISPTFLPTVPNLNPLPAIFPSNTRVVSNNFPLTQVVLNNAFEVSVPLPTVGMDSIDAGVLTVSRRFPAQNTYYLQTTATQDEFAAYNMYATNVNQIDTTGSLSVPVPAACAFVITKYATGNGFDITFQNDAFDFAKSDIGYLAGSSLTFSTVDRPSQTVVISSAEFGGDVGGTITFSFESVLPINLDPLATEVLTALTFSAIPAAQFIANGINITGNDASLGGFAELVTLDDLTEFGLYLATLQNPDNSFTFTPVYQVRVIKTTSPPLPTTWTVDFQAQFNVATPTLITTGQDIQTGYYSCYSARWWLSCLNRTLSNLWTAYGGDNTVDNAPCFTIDANTNLITLLTPFDPVKPINFAVDEQNATGIGSPYQVYIGAPAGTAPQTTNVNWCLFFNEPLMNLLSGFTSVYYGNTFDKPLIPRCGDEQTILLAGSRPYLFNYFVQPINYHGINVVTTINKTVDPPTKTNFYMTTSEYSPVPLWNPIQSVVFSTSLLPVVTSLTTAALPFNVFNGSNGSQSVGNNAQIQNMLSDIQVGLTSGSEYKPTILYVPSGEYRLIDMNGTTGIRTASFSVSWKTKYNQVVPFRLGSQCGANMKILFRRKRMYVGNVAPYDTN